MTVLKVLLVIACITVTYPLLSVFQISPCLRRSSLPNIKPTDIVNVGMFQKYKNQVEENVQLVGEIWS